MQIKQQYVHKSRYARYIPEEERRENWDETVERYISFFQGRGQLSDKDAQELQAAIMNQEVMPSMRCLMTAGAALERDNVAGFNCSYLPIDSPRAFDELMYILLCGTGVGFSVEGKYVEQLPRVAEVFEDTDTVINVADSKVGWAKAFRELVSLLYSGGVPKWDVSRVRPAGAPLKTFGGRASGPEPLVELFRFTVDLFRDAAGRRLTDLECHDLCCKIGSVVVVGGVRRSAEISLSDPNSDNLRGAKKGNWYDEDKQPYRGLANNSAVYEDKPMLPVFMKEWTSLYESYSGERGFFSRIASQKQAAKNGRRDPDHAFGTNPCSEIILRPHQFCNLSEVVIRPTDTYKDLQRKVRLATILGTLQATLTDFRYLRSIWKRNTEEEALLGVSFTGIFDNPMMYNLEGDQLTDMLESLKELAVETNKKWAKKLGINQSAAITCVKPSGTVSQLVDSASGIHPRYADYYIRRIRADVKDPLCSVLQDAGVPWEPVKNSDAQLVFSFPEKAPEGSVWTAGTLDGVQALKIWKAYQDHWCEHKPSVTIYYNDDNFMQIGAWLYENFDEVSGVSFLPYNGHVYEQAPYEPISKEEYEEMLEGFPTACDWNLKEESDVTEGSQELACTGGACELP